MCLYVKGSLSTGLTGQARKKLHPPSDRRFLRMIAWKKQHVTYDAVSLFMEQKLRENAEAACEKLSEPLLLHRN